MNANILVASFEPFGGLKTNSSQMVAQILMRELTAIKWIELPVSLACWPTLKAAIEKYQPKTILSLGQAEGRKNICLERSALNWLEFRIPDNEGAQPRLMPIEPEGPVNALNSMNLKALCEIAGEGVQVSHSAGTFVCNFLYYQMLRHEGELAYQSLFIHLPLATEQDQSQHPSRALSFLCDKTRRILKAL